MNFTDGDQLWILILGIVFVFITVLTLGLLYLLPLFLGFKFLFSDSAKIKNLGTRAFMKFCAVFIIFIWFAPWLYHLVLFNLTKEEKIIEIQSNQSIRESYRSRSYYPGQVVTTGGETFFYDNFNFFLFYLPVQLRTPLADVASQSTSQLKPNTKCKVITYGFPSNRYLINWKCEEIKKK